MARKPRGEKEPGVYHVYARGNNRETIFADDEDRRAYLMRLRIIARDSGWRILAYCLMGNHLHLLIETRKPNLGDGMRLLHGGHAQQFNRKYGRTGHVFGGRYGSTTITSDEHFRVAARYIAHNPLEAGLARELGEWPWDNWHPGGDAWAREIVETARLVELCGFAEEEHQARARLAAHLAAPAPP